MFLRTDSYKKVDHATAMIWKLLMVAEKTWRKLNSAPRLRDVYEGRLFVDGLPRKEKCEEKKEAA